MAKKLMDGEVVGYAAARRIAAAEGIDLNRAKDVAADLKTGAKLGLTRFGWAVMGYAHDLSDVDPYRVAA